MTPAMYGTNTTKARSIIIFLLLMICKMALVTDGLPVYRQEQDTTNYDDDDLIAGEAFLKMLLAVSRSPSAPYPSMRAHSFSEDADTTVESLEPSTTSQADVSTLPTTEFQKSVIRETRSSPQYVPPQRRGKTYTVPPQTSTRTTRSDNLGFSETSANSLNEDGMIISVRVSSSVGKSLINKKVSKSKDIMETTTITTEILEPTQIIDQTALQSEEHPTIVAEANKSDFSVDEGEPITRDNYQEDSNIKIPFHQSVIYHDNPKEPTRARSVSYSTVIQSLPQHPIRKSWENIPQSKPLVAKAIENENDEKAMGSMAESKDYYVTSKYDLNKPQTQAWRTDYPTATTVKHFEPTERNWGIPEKNYGVQEQAHQSAPIVYGQPEQNYEIDEAVSVESNGRVHGVQPSQTSPNQQRPQNQHNINTPSSAGPGSKKEDDNQKVGYVVEGRNYRKYRVEERTSDGFIVGEYGVVSHNDGSLRGVRYTADGTISPRLIYDALMKFLSL